ncbi:cartilage matrix protein [Octopus bimaculoides]|uniref:VWFA domain-containing protein n=1 Tax=Octopus bimaculoides TaxID=37653 RepID=A0A0L8FXK3_OCTBM|nr:cartilage matrix protein [Octopus bimaculoides]|eukprot:XP_014785973.1 PREDICTED: cartilage matrix protein-like [Octopus bimaculoides]
MRIPTLLLNIIGVVILTVQYGSSLPHTTSSSVQDCGTTKVDMMFLVDASSSMSQMEFMKEISFVKQIVSDSVVGPDHLQVSLVTFSTHVHKEFGLKQYKTKADVLAAISKVVQSGGITNTNLGLDYIRTNINKVSHGARRDAKQVLIVITDGASSNTQATKLSASRIHNTGIDVFAIGVGKGIHHDELNNIASVQDNIFQVNDFNALKTIEGTIKKKACATVAPRCGAEPTDILFLLDSSGSVRIAHFREALKFVSQFVADSIVGSHSLQVGVITFSTKVRNQIPLNKFSDKDALIKAIKAVKYDHGLTLTAKGLHFVRTEGFSAKNGGRPNATQILVVLTDGNSNQAFQTVRESKLIHLTHIKIFSIGVGTHISRKELEMISSDKKKNVFMVKDYDALKTIEAQLKNTICATTPPPPVCGVTPTDIVFLLDASGSISNGNFDIQLDFLRKFVNSSIIGRNSTQIGLVLFSSNVYNKFNMNVYHDKKALINAIWGVKRTAGSTKTADGLKYVRTNSLIHGSRKNAQHVVVVITDGQSDNKATTKSEAALLHKLPHTTVISIGVGRSVDRAELDSIASDKNHVFMVSDFSTLKKITSELFRAAC